MKTLFFGLLQGVAGAISGLNPLGRDGKRTPVSKRVNSNRRPIGRPRSHRRPNRSHRVRSTANIARYSKRQLEPPVTVADNSSAVPVVRQVAIYSCPACGLQAQAGLMAEHFLGSPVHQRGRAPPEHTAIHEHAAPPEPPADHRAEEESNGSEMDSRDSLRNLLQILLPPRAFGHRREQNSANDFSQVAQMLNFESRSRGSHVG